MSYQATRFAGGLRNIKGSGCVPYLGLFEQVQKHTATVQAQSALMVPEPRVQPIAATFNTLTGEWVQHYGSTDNVSVVMKVRRGVRMMRIELVKH